MAAKTLDKYLKKGLELTAAGKLDEAEEILIRGWEQDSATAGDRQTLFKIFRAFAALKFDKGQYPEASLFFEKAKAICPEDFSDGLALAFTWFALGNFDKALALATGAAKQLQDSRKTGLLVGRIHSARGNYQQAVEKLRQYTEAFPDDPEGLLELGFALEAGGNPAEASDFYAEIKSRHHDYFEKVFEKADVFFTQDYNRLAKMWLVRAEKIAPKDANIFFNLGRRYGYLGMMQDAERTLKAAIRMRPLGHYYRELADLYERANQLAKASAFARVPLQQFPDDPFLNLTLAKCEKRQGEEKAALARIDRVLDIAKETQVKSALLNLKGQILDRADRIEQAYQAFQASKDVAFDGDCDLRTAKQVPYEIMSTLMASDFTSLPKFSFAQDCKTGLKQMVFFMGFPRSGTTLVQHILDSHPETVTLDEKQVIRAPISVVDKMKGRFPAAIFDLTYEQAKDLRAIYLREIGNFVKTGPETVFIEKLPLNITSLPLIRTIFPEAKILFGLRHPFASCLSCLMQMFSMNRAMANLISIDEITRFYQAQMDVWIKSEKDLPLDYQYIRYEDVVADLEKETRKLVAFLDLEWVPEMMSYAENARAKGIIQTPSYSQVVRPIYKDSLERWRLYEAYFAPYRDRLAPYCEKFGYSY